MIVFYYDKTFEGLLTAVFDAYNRRQFPDTVVAEGNPVPLLQTEAFHVCTDTEKSGRVWRALDKKVPGYIRNMIMYVWHSEEAGSDALLFRYICKVFDSPAAILGDFGDPDVLKMRKLGQQVGHETERHRQFVRFQKTTEGTYFAAVSPRYNSLPLSLGYFRDRFADQRWLIYDLRRHYGFYYDLEKVIEVTLTRDDDLAEGKLSDEMTTEEEKQYRAMWRGYHKSIAIRERINPRLQRQFMPRRYWKLLPEMDEQ